MAPTTIGGSISTSLAIVRMVLIIAAIIAVIFTGLHIAFENKDEASVARAKKSIIIIVIVVIGLAIIGSIGAFMFHESQINPHIPGQMGGGAYSNQLPAFQIKNKNGFAKWLFNIIAGVIGFGVEVLANGFLVPVYTTAFSMANRLLCTIPDPFQMFEGNVGAGRLAGLIFYPLAIYLIITGIMIIFFLMLAKSSRFTMAEGKTLFYKVFITFLVVLAAGYIIGILNVIGSRLTSAILYFVHPYSLWRVSYGAHGSARIAIGVGDIIQNAGQNLINAFTHWTKDPTGMVNIVDAFGPYIPPNGQAIYFTSPTQGIIIGIMAIIQVGVSLSLLFIGLFRIVYFYVLVAIAPFMLATAAIPGQEKTAVHWIKEFIIVSLLPAFYALVFYFLVAMGSILSAILGVPVSGNVQTAQAVAISLAIYLSTSIVGFYLFKNGSRILGEFLQQASSFLASASNAGSQVGTAYGGAMAAGGAAGGAMVALGATALGPIGGAIGAGFNKFYGKIKRTEAKYGRGASATIPGGTGGPSGAGSTAGGVGAGAEQASAGSTAGAGAEGATDTAGAGAEQAAASPGAEQAAGSSKKPSVLERMIMHPAVKKPVSYLSRQRNGMYELERSGRGVSGISSSMARLVRDSGRYTGRFIR